MLNIYFNYYKNSSKYDKMINLSIKQLINIIEDESVSSVFKFDILKNNLNSGNVGQLLNRCQEKRIWNEFLFYAILKNKELIYDNLGDDDFKNKIISLFNYSSDCSFSKTIFTNKKIDKANREKIFPKLYMDTCDALYEFYVGLDDMHLDLVMNCFNRDVIFRLLNNDRMRKILLSENYLKDGNGFVLETLTGDSRIFSYIKDKSELYVLKYFKDYGRIEEKYFFEMLDNLFKNSFGEFKTLFYDIYCSCNLNNRIFLLDCMISDKINDVLVKIKKICTFVNEDKKQYNKIVNMLQWYPELVDYIVNNDLDDNQIKLLNRLLKEGKIREVFTNFNDVEKCLNNGIVLDSEFSSHYTLGVSPCAKSRDVVFDYLKEAFVIFPGGEYRCIPLSSHGVDLNAIFKDESHPYVFDLFSLCTNIAKEGIALFVIEGDVAQAYLPYNPTEEQKKCILNHFQDLNLDEKNCLFAICNLLERGKREYVIGEDDEINLKSAKYSLYNDGGFIDYKEFCDVINTKRIVNGYSK